MGFFSGRASFLRFKVNGPAPRLFDDEQIDRLKDRMAGRQRIASADGVETGWTAGDHVLDTDFHLAKNVINDTLTFDLRVDTDKLPNDLLRAYFAVELKALSKNNPSGFASARQKREAKEIARERLEQEAKDGRYKKRKCIPVLWDKLSNEVLFGATSLAQIDRLCSLFETTFGMELDCVTAGRRAYQLAEVNARTRMVDDSAPSAFIPGTTPSDVAWIADESSRDFIGNEFLLWLWYHTDVMSDTIKLADNSEVTIMLARTLNLECPRGVTGHETISHEGPTRLPEARRAIQSGKLPRKVGLTLVRHSEQYELSLHAETLAVGGAKLPPPDEAADARGKLDDRANQLRALIETLDLLYNAFGEKRFGKEWETELAGMQKWLKREERRAA
jgi:recombination associated protein RdgC